MKLTGTDIDKVYTEQLTKLLLNGYTIVVARENGSLEQDKGKYNRTLLEKGGNRFEFGFWYVEINSNTEKQILGLMISVGYSFITSPSLTAAFTNFGRMDTPLLAIAL